MKTMNKILIAGVIFILIGGIFCGAAYAMGEKYMDSTVTNTSEIFANDKINSIYISENIAEIKILKTASNSGEIKVTADNVLLDEFKCLIKNDSTLEISYNPKVVKFGFISLPSAIFNWGSKTPKIAIYVPDGRIFDEVRFNGGVGEVNAEQINAQYVILNGGVGEYDIKEMNAGKLDINGGMGKVKIDGVINGDATIDSGVGEMIVSGQINGNIKLKAGVGSIKFDLTGDESDYNIKASKGVGSITINGLKDSDYKGKYNQNNNGEYNIDIDAGVGEIDINIKQYSEK